MLTKNINFKNFKLKKNSKKIGKDLKILLKENSALIQSLSPSYKNSYSKNLISKIKKNTNIRIIGMGGSILGTESIYNFLRHKIKKNFSFINNLQAKIKLSNTKKNMLT